MMHHHWPEEQTGSINKKTAQNNFENSNNCLNNLLFFGINLV
jgi:hypothetical protein